MRIINKIPFSSAVYLLEHFIDKHIGLDDSLMDEIDDQYVTSNEGDDIVWKPSNELLMELGHAFLYDYLQSLNNFND